MSGVSAISVYSIGLVWAMEMVAGKWKTLVGMSFGITWTLAR